MKLAVYILVVIGSMLLAMNGSAQTKAPVEWFNQAAREYVQQDRLTALRTLDKGLREHPGDAKMLKLAEELLKDEQQQQEQEQKQQQQEQEKEEQEKENEEQQQQEKQGDDEGEEEEQRKEKEKEQGKQKQEQQEQRKGEKERPANMTPQDAQRILDALERQEAGVQEKARERLQPVVKTPIEKDW